MSADGRTETRNAALSFLAAANDAAKGLAEVLVQSLKDLFTDSGPQWAAAIAYYALLSVFPLLLLIGSVASFIVDPDWAVKRVTNVLGEFVPQDPKRVEDIVQGAIDARGQVGLLSFVAILWTGTRIFSALIRALNVAFDAKKTYGIIKRFVIEVAMLVTIGLTAMLALASGLLLRGAWTVLDMLPAGQDVVFRLLQGTVRGAFLLLAFFLIYRVIPRDHQHWQTALIGSSVSTILFLAARPIFLFYVQRFGDYNLIYGSLATAIVLMIWVWIVALITLFGGEVAAHAKAMLVDGRSSEDVGKHHEKHSAA